MLSYFADLKICVDEIAHSILHPEILDQGSEGLASILLDKGAEMWLAIVEEFSQRGQGNILIVVLNILQYK